MNKVSITCSSCGHSALEWYSEATIVVSVGTIPCSCNHCEIPGDMQFVISPEIGGRADKETYEKARSLVKEILEEHKQKTGGLKAFVLPMTTPAEPHSPIPGFPGSGLPTTVTMSQGGLLEGYDTGEAYDSCGTSL